MNKIFVYGSLRKHGGLHGAVKNTNYLGKFNTRPEYNLYSLGAFPALVKNGKTSIVGELYEVNEEVLRTLDMIEGHPDFYCRTPITLDNGESCEVYLLPNAPNGCPIVDSGDWIKFRYGIND